MITCFIRYEIDPFKVDAFDEYARNWGQAIPRCGADLIGYYAPHEGSSAIAYGVYNIKNLADYEPIASACVMIRSVEPITSSPRRSSSSAARTASSFAWHRHRMRS